MPSNAPPTIQAIRPLAETRLFRVEGVDLRFANGTEVQFERLKGSSNGAVIVAALTADEEFVLIREYACGTERYELGLPKGRIDAGETAVEAANRELREEAGFAARRLTRLNEMTMAPTYSGQRTQLVLAESLYPDRLPGDEPEPLEVSFLPMAELDEFAASGDCSEARSLAAMFLVRAYRQQRQREGAA
ncbi:ADP compounds hydrolase NudE [Guyparkeria halophila]|uniref:ADP compounds hydrolase NudE n=1 Tax=Guyparkeria halophila TaxID=47960 RepID=A0A6I6D0J7_9GAMM|nr:ADP compounds hydrolase NudE [Guyparkeria halophila]QGT77557.1 ADP compounds hydrolase NudE [Guyparkeria halophila]